MFVYQLTLTFTPVFLYQLCPRPSLTLTLTHVCVPVDINLDPCVPIPGLPRPSLKWYKDNEELGSSQDIRMEFREGKGRLIMDKLDLEQGSKFTCVASNVAGEQSTEATVNHAGEVTYNYHYFNCIRSHSYMNTEIV